MIYLQFKIPKYKWKVLVYYHKTTYYVRDILENMEIIGCNQDCLDLARDSLIRGNLNSGLCYSNSKNRETIIVIALTSSPEQFINSWWHEAKHLLSHIEQEFDIDPYSEEAAYLLGYIGQKMFSVARKFLCKCYS